MSGDSGSLDALDQVLSGGGDADDVLREIVRVLAERYQYVAIKFVEGDDLLPGPTAGTPDESTTALPITFPADEINGFMLAGMDAPGVSSKGFCYPASLYAELRAQGIAYEIDTLNLARLAQQQPYQLPEH